ncbi:DUF2281 domain-containing protein [Crocosphaera sp.]|uniref:DUF2281 domain-containing protein n=1 Tax=Crocosphaera sp. TaxID=2729996 RepID=UPI00262EB70A|nr:DUF2281 domain-containing protein [Crocosphaera sp.]MDJ0582659.1 DUF2281 domain-containing protein [Crocosphaera sp.]
MTVKEQLIQEIEKAPDSLVEEVLNFLLCHKSKHKPEPSDKIALDSIEEQLQRMANDPDIQAELAMINEEFKSTDMDGLA